MDRHIFRQWALLVAGALIGVIVSLLTPQPGVSNKLIAALATVTFLLLLFGGSVDSYMVHRYHLKARRCKPKIAILNDMGWSSKDSQIKSWTNYAPQEWKTEILKLAKEDGLRVAVSLITTRNNFDPYSIVINPYGGVYPEENLITFGTLSKIFRYVEEGGLFVNVADIPGYCAYNPLLKRRTETAPPFLHTMATENKIGFQELRFFTRVPWMQRLGLTVSNTEGSPTRGIRLNLEMKLKNINYSELGPIDLDRAVRVESDVQVVLGHPHNASGVKMELGSSYPDTDLLTPMFSAAYGSREFLVSLFNLESQQPARKEVRKVLIATFFDSLRSRSSNAHCRWQNFL